MKKIIITLSLLLFSSMLSAQEQKLKSVLFEEFTGEWCPYCPAEYPAIERLAKAFEKKGVEVSVVAHHMRDAFALSKSYYSSLNFGIDGYPSTSINRKSSSWRRTLITQVQGINTDDFVKEYMEDNEDLAEFTKTSTSVKDDVLVVKVEGRVFNQVNKDDCYLTAILTEDNVQGIRQRNHFDSSNTGRNYTHHKMARAYLTLGIGEKLSPKPDGTFALNLEEFKLNSAWKKDDLRVVIFLNKYIKAQDMSERYVLTSQTLKLNETREVKPKETTALEDLEQDAPLVSASFGKIQIKGLYDSVEVYDLQGRLLAQDLKRNYPKGVYILKIKQEDKQYIHKLSL